MLSQKRLLEIVTSDNLPDLSIFIKLYTLEKNHNPAVEDFFNVFIDDGYTAFSIATIKNNVEMMRMLFSAGSNPELQSQKSFAPIHLAVKYQRQEALDYLISLKINLDLKSNIENKTAIMYGSHRNSEVMIELLVANGANADETSDEGTTATHIAAANNHLLALRGLIKVKANLDKANIHDNAPVHLAAFNNHYQVLAMLIHAGVNINARTKESARAVTALYVAVIEEHLESVRTILESGKAELNYQYENELRTAIFHAAYIENAEIFTLLYRHKADIHITAYLNNSEINIRRLVRARRRNGASAALDAIYNIINAAPRFPNYVDGISFTYHSIPNPEADAMSEKQSRQEHEARMKGQPYFDFAGLINTKLFYLTETPRPRRRSYCDYGASNELDSTYSKEKLIGKGTYGSVIMMKFDGYQNKNLAIKKIAPECLTFYGFNTADDINEYLTQSYQKIAREAYVNYIIHGIGAVYFEQKPIEFEVKDNNIKLLTSYPHAYIAMRHFDGTPLINVNILTMNAYFQIFSDFFKKLQAFHKKFVHGDIKQDNIIVDIRNLTVNLIDFSLSRPANEILELKNLNLIIKPPEYQNKDFIRLAPTHDIYCAGRVLKIYSRPELFYPQTYEKLNTIISNMMDEDPQKRMTAEQAITCLQDAKSIQIYYDDLYSSVANFIAEFKKIPAVNQIEYLKKLDLSKIKLLFNQLEDMILLLSTVKSKNRTAFISLMDLNLLNVLQLSFSYYSDRNYKIGFSTLLFHSKEAFNDKFQDEIIAGVFRETFQHHNFEKFITNSNKESGINFTNGILKIIISQFVKENNIKTCLDICDKFKQNPGIYKQVLLIVNQVYREQRHADPRKYYSIFGWYSKQDKVRASLDLENSLMNDNLNDSVFKTGELNQGNLGQIAKRLRMCG